MNHDIYSRIESIIEKGRSNTYWGAVVEPSADFIAITIVNGDTRDYRRIHDNRRSPVEEVKASIDWWTQFDELANDPYAIY